MFDQRSAREGERGKREEGRGNGQTAEYKNGKENKSRTVGTVKQAED